MVNITVRPHLGNPVLLEQANIPLILIEYADDCFIFFSVPECIQVKSAFLIMVVLYVRATSHRSVRLTAMGATVNEVSSCLCKS